MYCLQSRWKLEEDKLYYYGLRNRDKMFKNTVRLKKAQIQIIMSLPKELSSEEKKVLGNLMGEQIVHKNDLRKIPKNLYEARFCTCCYTNDFIIPGLEFDSDGKCPMCQTKDIAAGLKSVVPLVEDIKRSKKITL